MISVGIDLAADPATTAVAVLDRTAGRWSVSSVECGATDDRLVELGAAADTIGIDCPLGWPAAFVDFVTRHHGGGPLPPADSVAARRVLAYRRTDLEVIEQHGLRPLSVAADRIGHAALRCAGLLARLGETDRSGRGRVVEVYPAGSLRRWGLPYRGYKGRDGAAARTVIVAALAEVIELGPARARCLALDHELDAVVAALSAAAARAGRATLPTADVLAVARVEGWIALPTCDLSEFARPT